MLAVSLGCPSSLEWLDTVLSSFDDFILDHAANERKASSMAMTLVAHYPDRQRLVTAMVDLALEELNHFRQVIRLMHERGLVMPPDEKDPYVNQLRAHIRKGPEDYFLDRLLSAAVIEARGEERFSLIADALQDQKLAGFYNTLARSEQGHHQLFVEIALAYFPEEQVALRLADWTAIESQTITQLPVTSRLH